MAPCVGVAPGAFLQALYWFWAGRLASGGFARILAAVFSRRSAREFWRGELAVLRALWSVGR